MSYLDKAIISYYPEKNYIPMESTFKLSNVDVSVNRKLPITTNINVKDTTELWIFIIKYKDLNNKFFNDVHNIDLNNVVLPQNVISATYYNGLEETIFLS